MRFFGAQAPRSRAHVFSALPEKKSSARQGTTRSAGVAVSDTSVTWLVLESTAAGRSVHSFDAIALPSGVVENGVVKEVNALAATLQELKARLKGVTHVHAALPEEVVYVFGMSIPTDASHEQTLRMIEFELHDRVPIPASAALYDFEHISSRSEERNAEIGVAVVSREHFDRYSNAFRRAGLPLVSFEPRPRSIARAVSSPAQTEAVELIVDIGRARTGFSVVKCDVPIFTSTAEIGDDAITRALMQTLSLSESDAEIFKREQGLEPDDKHRMVDAQTVINAISALADEIVHHHRYWDIRRDDRGERITPVARVVLVGSGSGLRGLRPYIAGRVQARTELGEVWRNAFSFEEHIPPIDARSSLEYAACAGLALRDVPRKKS